jgi:hypothetical protein
VSGAPVIVEAPLIRAVFEPADDRWTHRIELTSDSRPPVVIMRSLEGTSDDPRPPSPVIQHLEFQVERDGTPAAMGIGNSGRIHWSLACRAVPLGSSATSSGSRFWYLLFEVACRTAEAFPRVGTCYHILPEISVQQHPQYLNYRCAEGEWSAGSNSAVLSNANQTLRMDVFAELNGLFPQTIQWSYAINRTRRGKA